MSSARTNAATQFLIQVASGEPRRAAEAHLAPNFKHHNPFFGAGADTLIDAMEENAKRFPDMTLSVERSIEEGNYVAVHSRIKPAPDHETLAACHIFRFESDRIAELWDIVQAEPNDSPNADGMF
jgi:predicted SnoaL-like aldol condensation-catalyzing enzyme